jgi:hypothetical protein
MALKLLGGLFLMPFATLLVPLSTYQSFALKERPMGKDW